MAQHNTDYGLVYDDESKICVTKRTDIIPFSGVTSYAVETATTNLITDINPINWRKSDGVTVELTTGKYMNMPVYKVTLPETSGTFISYDTIDYTDGEWLTASVYIKPVQYSPTRRPSLYLREYNFGTVYTSQLFPTAMNTWSRMEVSFQFSGTGTIHVLLYTPIATNDIPNIFYMTMPQVENKPFASSFVNGSRPKGRLVVEPDDLGFNPGTDDWVVSYRKYPVATRNDILTDYNFFSFGRYTSGNTEGYILWGKENNSNIFRLKVVYSDNTGEGVGSTTFDPAWYFRHWHHEVLLKHGSEMQYWVDGILLIQMALTKTLLNNFTLGLTINGYGGGNPCNSYIANLCYGKYTDQWTPEYIQRISAMTSTFYVPTKRVIV